MLGFILLITINGALFLGTVMGVDNALNVADFVMWITAVSMLIVMFTSEKDLMKQQFGGVFRWMTRLMLILTVGHCVFWGYFWAPTFMTLGWLVLVIRKYEIQNKPTKD